MNQNLYLYDIWSMQKIYMTFLQPLGAETYAEACQTSSKELFAFCFLLKARNYFHKKHYL